ncbi:hypothetical protein J1N35_007393, partial [Gossypium stocksii]
DEISDAMPLIFLHDCQRQFQNAHKLFGVNNITKIIKNFNPPKKDIVMLTILFQSDTQANDPVGCCYRIIQELPHQIEYSQTELELVFISLPYAKHRLLINSRKTGDVSFANERIWL